MNHVIAKVMLALCIMLGSSLGLSMQRAQDVTSRVSAYWSSFLNPAKNPEQATKELLALLQPWPYVDRPQPAEQQFTAENISKFIKEGADVNAQNADGWTPLIKAITSRNVQIVRLLLNAGAKIDEKKAPVALAAMYDSPDIVDQLIAFGADVNQKDERGVTPLYWASMLENSNIAQALLNAGADVNVQSFTGITPLMRAILNNKPDLVRLFLNEDTDLTIKDKKGETALDKAKKINNPIIINLLNAIPKQFKKKIG